ncbi:EboA domain-containing protein [Sphingobacterium endophyticum]|uniref:EboA domain-containing protein n=1 Tax=Sphingobacterium endophyticum TaxID=2546448 RepID=UPI0012E210A8|nr:EboA domain-containing protein [Sphingobacterium endophyticum]
MEWKENVRNTLFELLTAEDKSYLVECEQSIAENYSSSFVKFFSSLSRKLNTSKDKLVSMVQEDDNPLIVEHWTVLRLARVYLLSLIQDQQEPYFTFLEKLFNYSDMQELVALYSALNIYQFPKIWIDRCQEGIRNNIGPVQEAIMEQNKFPANYLSEEAWNQLVLKSFFTGKDIKKIYGLYERNNVNLANSIVDYIYERDSAKREIHPMLWELAKDHLPPRAVEILKQQKNLSPELLEKI